MRARPNLRYRSPDGELVSGDSLMTRKGHLVTVMPVAGKRQKGKTYAVIELYDGVIVKVIREGNLRGRGLEELNSVARYCAMAYGAVFLSAHRKGSKGAH